MRIEKMSGRSRASVLGALAFFAAIQMAFFYPLSSLWPELHDPQYGGKLSRLRACLAKKSDDQPLILVLGSSHTGMGVRPSILRYDAAEGAGPMLFNFSINDGCPMVSLLNLHRLLNQGIRPDVVLLETDAFQLWLDGRRAQFHLCLPLTFVQRQDLSVLSRYYSNPHTFRMEWRKLQVAPWYAHRDYLLSYLCPWFSPSRRLQANWNHVDKWGWQWVEGATRSYLENGFDLKSLQKSAAASCREFQIRDADFRSIGEIVTTCRDRNIRVAFLRMPVAKFLQDCYPQSMREPVDAYLSRLSKDYHVPVIDARDWAPDSYFADGHHLTPDGATVFTQRLDREVLQTYGNAGWSSALGALHASPAFYR